MDPYEVLGIGAGLSAKELKSRHRELAKRNHPDHFEQGSPEAAEAERRLAEINAAYQLLTRPDEMARHKSFLRKKKAAATAAPAPEGGGAPADPDFNYRRAANAEFWGVAETDPTVEYWTASGKKGKRRLWGRDS